MYAVFKTLDNLLHYIPAKTIDEAEQKLQKAWEKYGELKLTTVKSELPKPVCKKN